MVGGNQTRLFETLSDAVLKLVGLDIRPAAPSQQQLLSRALSSTGREQRDITVVIGHVLLTDLRQVEHRTCLSVACIPGPASGQNRRSWHCRDMTVGHAAAPQTLVVSERADPLPAATSSDRSNR